MSRYFTDGLHDSSPYLEHHGVKGQKWGVRRYENYDGTPTSKGKKRYSEYNKTDNPRTKPIPSRIASTVRKYANEKMTHVQEQKAILGIGKQQVDYILKSGTDYSRIQLGSMKIEKDFAQYTTYLKSDQKMYRDLFSNNLKTRSRAAAKQAIKQAKKTMDPEDMKNAMDKAETANQKVYQVKFTTSKDLKAPSTKNASDITVKTMAKNQQFKDDVLESIGNAKRIMKRPSQQAVFNEATKLINNKPLNKLSDKEKETIYKAYNVTLTNHSAAAELNSQKTFYNTLKKAGYGAIRDENDRDFSSYHAKNPLIIFDTASIKRTKVHELDDNTIAKNYVKANMKRVLRDTPEQLIKTPIYGISSLARKVRAH